ncbi:uncharacterized protein RCC_04453 [Ramularia collo-cygni]|uniref:Uncharacterized protein n=1 Tax=Ramularia collo-cygni TaxID=112498 RepID=A0A2D3VAN9_9PEZI|nr:uncharacterized protein RCC_04453 [Ramularia collo-cygni]CZT18609.1 uncharacterized protein RCC_04453 [Ramularia collo-cygni]
MSYHKIPRMDINFILNNNTSTSKMSDESVYNPFGVGSRTPNTNASASAGTMNCTCRTFADPGGYFDCHLWGPLNPGPNCPLHPMLSGSKAGIYGIMPPGYPPSQSYKSQNDGVSSTPVSRQLIGSAYSLPINPEEMQQDRTHLGLAPMQSMLPSYPPTTTQHRSSEHQSSHAPGTGPSPASLPRPNEVEPWRIQPPKTPPFLQCFDQPTAYRGAATASLGGGPNFRVDDFLTGYETGPHVRSSNGTLRYRNYETSERKRRDSTSVPQSTNSSKPKVAGDNPSSLQEHVAALHRLTDMPSRRLPVSIPSPPVAPRRRGEDKIETWRARMPVMQSKKADTLWNLSGIPEQRIMGQGQPAEKRNVMKAVESSKEMAKRSAGSSTEKNGSSSKDVVDSKPTLRVEIPAIGGNPPRQEIKPEAGPSTKESTSDPLNGAEPTSTRGSEVLVKPGVLSMQDLLPKQDLETNATSSSTEQSPSSLTPSNGVQSASNPAGQMPTNGEEPSKKAPKSMADSFAETTSTRASTPTEPGNCNRTPGFERPRSHCGTRRGNCYGDWSSNGAPYNRPERWGAFGVQYCPPIPLPGDHMPGPEPAGCGKCGEVEMCEHELESLGWVDTKDETAETAEIAEKAGGESGFEAEIDEQAEEEWDLI